MPFPRTRRLFCLVRWEEDLATICWIENIKGSEIRAIRLLLYRQQIGFLNIGDVRLSKYGGEEQFRGLD